MKILPKSARARVLLLGLVLWASACDSDTTSFDHRFPLAAEHGIDALALELAYAQAEEIEGIQSLLVQRNGVLVAEGYFHDFEPTTLHDVRSVTKSAISLLIGIAIDKGYIDSIDQRLGEFLPEGYSTDERRSQITIRSLLMMSSGLDWHELDGGDSYSDWWYSDDMIQHLLDLPIVHEQEERFIYNTGASHLLSVILTEATGMPTLDFAREHLFTPIGITSSDWLLLREQHYAGGMRITARAMMKIGQMCLDGGMYDGTRIVSADWVSESTRSHISTNNAVPFGPEYGYLWWVGQEHGLDLYFGNGYGGQFIVVVPDLDVVVVASSWWSGIGRDAAGEQWYTVISLIMEGIVPTVG